MKATPKMMKAAVETTTGTANNARTNSALALT